MPSLFPGRLGMGPRPCSDLASLLPARAEMVTEMMQYKPGRGEAGRVKLVTMAKALGPCCQGQTLLEMLAPAPASSPSHLVDGWKRKRRETLPSATSSQLSPVTIQQQIGSHTSKLIRGWACRHTLVHKGPSFFSGTKNVSQGERWVGKGLRSGSGIYFTLSLWT